MATKTTTGVLVSSGGGGRSARYSQGWRSAEQDRKPAPRVARVTSQDYNTIKQGCLAQKALWEDPEFPATDKSIYPSSPGPLPFKWMRATVSRSVFRLKVLMSNAK